MKPYGVNDLRRMFLEFFESKEHLKMKSFSLVPHNDNSFSGTCSATYCARFLSGIKRIFWFGRFLTICTAFAEVTQTSDQDLISAVELI